MRYFTKVWRALTGNGDASETLARLLLAAKEAGAFRERVLSILHLPATQRESLINSAVYEMRMRGEAEADCAAFATLASDEGAAMAWCVLEEE